MDSMRTGKIEYLFYRYSDGSITREEMDTLNAAMQESELVQQKYFDFVKTEFALNYSQELISNAFPNPPASITELEVLAEYEKTAPAIELPKEAPKREIVQKVIRERVPYKLNKINLIFAVFSTAALLFLALFIHFADGPVGQEVATVAGSMNARWGQGDVSLQKGMRLSVARAPLLLHEGIVELKFDNDARVVIEAPAEFQILAADRIGLEYGKVYATVPPQAIGFSVYTESAKVIDLGTEFGIRVDLQGDTELHVMKGMIRLVSGLAESRVNMDVCEGAARKLSGATGQVHEIPFKQRLFVRSIDSQRQLTWKGQALSLADLVGGGDGFAGGLLKAGIDVTTGRRTAPLLQGNMGQGTAGFRPVDFSPYVDGVFIPGAGEEDTQITADGSLTVAFPVNSGSYWGSIFNGGYHKSQNVEEHPLRLNGMVFDGRENAAVTIHSNQGITFDLSRVRRDLPGIQMTRFRSLIGVSQTVATYYDGPGPYPAADFWVLLDGRQAYRGQLTNTDQAVGLDIPIPAGTRYLTLAVTEADGTAAFDWALFGNPELVLESSGAPGGEH